MAYYDFSPESNVLSPAIVVLSGDVLMPTQWKGFLVVTSIVIIYLTVVFCTTLIFIRGTKVSLLQDSSQGLAQARTDEVESILKERENPPEKEAKEVIKRLGLDKTYVGIGRLSDLDHGNVGIMRRPVGQKSRERQRHHP